MSSSQYHGGTRARLRTLAFQSRPTHVLQAQNALYHSRVPTVTDSNSFAIDTITTVPQKMRETQDIPRKPGEPARAGHGEQGDSIHAREDGERRVAVTGSGRWYDLGGGRSSLDLSVQHILTWDYPTARKPDDDSFKWLALAVPTGLQLSLLNNTQSS